MTTPIPDDPVSGSLYGPLRAAVVSLDPSDRIIEDFVRVTESLLAPRGLIARVERAGTMLIAFKVFEELSALRAAKAYNVLVIAMHGEKYIGEPMPEFPLPPIAPYQMSDWSSWMNWLIGTASWGALVVLAVCYSGRPDIIEGMCRGAAQATYLLTPPQGRPLSAKIGACALSDMLIGMGEAESQEHSSAKIQTAYAAMNAKYPDIYHMKRWDETYGS